MPAVSVQVRAAEGLKAMVAKSISMSKTYKGGETSAGTASHNLGENSVLTNLSKATRFEFAENHTATTTSTTPTTVNVELAAPVNTDFVSQLTSLISSMVGEKNAQLFAGAFQMSDSTDSARLRKKRRAYRPNAKWDFRIPLLEY
ncbi:MAG: hypothetical protein O3A01_03940 [bacterium]|nr:hypothetical protein [bacterium]